MKAASEGHKMAHEAVKLRHEAVKVPRQRPRVLHEVQFGRLGYNGNMNATLETSVVSSSPDVMSGAAVFAGTRVPAQSLLDYLAGGHTLAEFLEDFPTVTQEQAVQLLHELGQSFELALEK